MTPEQRAELRRLAEAATPGPWDKLFIGGPLGIDIYEVGPEGSWPVAQVGTIGDGVVTPPHSGKDADAAYIAAANPQTILALLDELDATHD